MAEITVSILSWMLEDRLIKTLKRIPESTTMPLNLCLHVQGAENISAEKELEIINAADGFEEKDIFFTPHNQGTAKPRSELLPRSAKTPFVLMTDNDMDFPQGGIDELYNFLTNPDNSDYGIVNLIHNRQTKINVIEGNSYKRIPVDLTKREIIYNIALMGSASMLLRREIALTPNIIDSRYIIGVWDYDFCLNVRGKGWKLATISDPNLIAINDKTYVTQPYQRVRHQSAAIRAGLGLYYQKWKDHLRSRAWLRRATRDMFKKDTDWKSRIDKLQIETEAVEEKAEKEKDKIVKEVRKEKVVEEVNKNLAKPKAKYFSRNIASRKSTNFKETVYA